MRLLVRPGKNGYAPPDFQGPSVALRTARDVRRFTSFWALSPDDPIPGPSSCEKEKRTLPRATADVSGLAYVTVNRLVQVRES